MIRLDNDDLPTSVAAGAYRAPLLRLGQATAPWLKVNFYARYGEDPGFDPVEEPMPSPLAVGYLYTWALPFTTASITQVGAEPVWPNADDPRHGYGWHDSTRLLLYSSLVTAGEAIAIKAVAQTQSPLPDQSFVYSLDISTWEDFTASKITSEGLTFNLAANPGAPVVGEFTQSGGAIALYGSATYRVRPFANLEIEGTWGTTVPTASAVMASYDVRGLVDYLDRIDHLGVAFLPVQDPYAPAAGSFYYVHPRLTLVAPVAVAPALQTQLTQSQSLGSGLGSSTYEAIERIN